MRQLSSTSRHSTDSETFFSSVVVNDFEKFKSMSDTIVAIDMTLALMMYKKKFTQEIFSGEINIIKKIYEISAKIITFPYIFAVLWITLIDRMTTHNRRITPPFWEILEIIHGDTEMVHYLIGNVIMLMPLGFLLPVWFNKVDNWKKAALIGLAVSTAIEVTQLITSRGLFEFDDIIHNTLGTVAGYYIEKLTEKIFFKSE